MAMLGMTIGADGLPRAPRRVPARRGRRVSPAQMERMLALVRDERASIPTACAMTGIAYSWVEARRKRDPRFAQALDEATLPALGEVRDALKAAATQRDDRGRYDVRAQELYLSIHDPEYRAVRRAQMAGGAPAPAVQVNVTSAAALSPEERVLIAELARRRLGIGPDAAAAGELAAGEAQAPGVIDVGSAGSGAPEGESDAAGD